MNKSTLFFYLLSFLEGASVMAAELLGAKMLAPYFGTSLYVWSSVLAVTLGGLAIGYFAGGVISCRKNKERNLYYILLASAVFLLMMPVLAKEVMLHTAGLSLLASILISSFVFLFPPVFCMGMVSPLIVECIAHPNPPEGRELSTKTSPLWGDKRGASGKTAGTVYAISTVGGILATFFLGFYVIPIFGLTKPAIIIGILLGVTPFVKLITMKKFSSLIFLVAVLSVVQGLFSSSKWNTENSGIKILYSSEGLLGQIIVADYPTSPLVPLSLVRGDGGEVNFQRILFVNRSTQTIVTVKNNEKSFFEYVHMIDTCTKGSLQDQQALVLGLGGGSVANILVKNGLQVDAVELDARMVEVANKYFELSAKVNVHIDDARHFLRSKSERTPSEESGIRNSGKYGVIVLDAFIGEVNPHHLFTQEFFKEINAVLSEEGSFFINGNGYWNGEAGKGMRSVCKTLINSGFNVEVLPTQEEEDYRNLVFIAKKNKRPVGGVTSTEIRNLDLDDALVLSDEKPQLEILNAEANKRWRESCMKYFLSGYYSKQDVLLFK